MMSNLKLKNNYRTFLIIFFVLYAIGLGTAIAVTCSKYPLFDFNINDLEWSKNWLIATVVDYYGAAIPLCIICILSEASIFIGILWSLGFLLLGSPVCCLYCIYRLVFKSLVLNNTAHKNSNDAHLQLLDPSHPVTHKKNPMSMYENDNGQL